MKAVIRKANPKKGFYAAEIVENEEYVVFELLDTREPEQDDVIEINELYALGVETIKNGTQNHSIEVCIEDYTNLAGAIRFLNNSDNA